MRLVAADQDLAEGDDGAPRGDREPGVEIRGDLGEQDTLLSIDKARRLLGFRRPPS
jgi:hypothetical protein